MNQWKCDECGCLIYVLAYTLNHRHLCEECHEDILAMEAVKEDEEDETTNER